MKERLKRSTAYVTLLIMAMVLPNIVHADWVTTTIPAGDQPRAIAINPVTNKIYVADNENIMIIIDAVNEHETGVIAEVDGSLNNITYEAMPTITGKAVNRWNPEATTILGVVDNWLVGQEEWVWANVISGTETDSIHWQYSWHGDSLIYGENFVNIEPIVI
jgi:hypothetical protein